MNKILITQSNYIPWKGYFDAINMSDMFVLYDDMQYTKRDWRNRNLIITPKGTQWLSIPVEVKGKYLQKINETQISDKNWNKDHWNILKEHYSKSPFFKDFKDFFEHLYLTCTKNNLSEINQHFLCAICNLLQINTHFALSSEFNLRGDKSEKLLNICLDSQAGIYYSGPAAKGYLDIALFEQHNIKVEWLDYSGYPEYPQQSVSFEHGVTILDLIFNTGKHAVDYLKSTKKYSHEKNY